MRNIITVVVVTVVVTLAATALVLRYGVAARSPRGAAPATVPNVGTLQGTGSGLDQLLAPVALYPDSLLAQVLLCTSDPQQVLVLNNWLKKQTKKGTELQDAALKEGFDASFVAMSLFPQVVDWMASQIGWTTELGKAFAADRAAVFDSIQRLRAQAQKSGALKDTPQQDVETKTTTKGDQVIVIEPANPQVVYVPQYNPAVVYTQPATTTTVVVEKDDHTDAAVAGIIGFTAGIAIGAAMDNDYYYGPYGWRGGGYMYNDAWDDYYDHREDAREDWMDHREDMMENRTDRANEAREQRGDYAQNRTDTRSSAQSERQTNRQSATSQSRTTAGTQSKTTSATAQTRTAGSSTYESRGRTTDSMTAGGRSGTRSDAFSGYSSGSSTRAASSRGQSSRGSAKRSGGGGRRR